MAVVDGSLCALDVDEERRRAKYDVLAWGGHGGIGSGPAPQHSETNIDSNTSLHLDSPQLNPGNRRDSTRDLFIPSPVKATPVDEVKISIRCQFKPIRRVTSAAVPEV